MLLAKIAGCRRDDGSLGDDQLASGLNSLAGIVLPDEFPRWEGAGRDFFAGLGLIATGAQEVIDPAVERLGGDPSWGGRPRRRRGQACRSRGTLRGLKPVGRGGKFICQALDVEQMARRD